MKIGDKVRFLSEVGGGVVAGFQPGGIVLVEDEDGFQIPMQTSDVVVVGNEDYSTSHLVQNKMQPQKKHDENKSIKALMNDTSDDEPYEDVEPMDKNRTFKKPTEERKGGDRLSAYIAFVPINIKEVSTTRFETYFVNDSNYYMQYTYLTAEGAGWRLKARGEAEPNTKLFIEEFGREDLNDMNRIAVQIIAYKREKPFLLKPTVDSQFRLDAVKFYKLHTFTESEFFETPALVYTLIENDKTARPLVVDADQIKSEMYRKADASDGRQDKTRVESSAYQTRYDDKRHQGNPFIIKRRGDDDVIVVDLHADEILETTRGMQPIDILNYQLKVFRDTLEANKKKRSQKIVFIHGKGEGVLRRAIINELRYKYKSYTYQDASFQEYGYGATQVTIR